MRDQDACEAERWAQATAAGHRPAEKVAAAPAVRREAARREAALPAARQLPWVATVQAGSEPAARERGCELHSELRRAESWVRARPELRVRRWRCCRGGAGLRDRLHERALRALLPYAPRFSRRRAGRPGRRLCLRLHA